MGYLSSHQSTLAINTPISCLSDCSYYSAIDWFISVSKSPCVQALVLNLNSMGTVVRWYKRYRRCALRRHCGTLAFSSLFFTLWLWSVQFRSTMHFHVICHHRLQSLRDNWTHTEILIYDPRWTFSLYKNLLTAITFFKLNLDFHQVSNNKHIEGLSRHWRPLHTFCPSEGSSFRKRTLFLSMF